MKAHQTNFSQGSVQKNIMQVMLPMMVAQLLNLLYNIVDRMYIGQMKDVGTQALSGLGLCFPILMFVTAFANLVGSGGAPLCAMERGKGNRQEAERIMCNSFFLLLLLGAGLTIAGLIFHKPLLYLFGASDAIYPYARDYIMIYLCGSIFVMIALGMNPFINSQGFARVGMLTVLLGALANIALDPVFIFVLGWGVRGAAFATILSQFLSAVWVVGFLRGRNAELKLRREEFRLEARRVKKILSLGTAGFVMSCTNSVVQAACNSMLQTFGGDLYIGVMTVVNSIREIAQTPAQAMGDGASPVMSYNYGEGQCRKVKRGIWFMTLLTVIYLAAMWLILFLFPRLFISIFNRDPELVETAVPCLHLYFFGFFMMAFQIAGQSVFKSLGKARQAIFFSLFRKIIIVVPLTFILPSVAGLGVMGVFLAEPISNFIGGAACFITMCATILPELRIDNGRTL